MVLVIFFLALTVLAVVGIAGTLRALRTDGYRRLPTDWSRVP